MVNFRKVVSISLVLLPLHLSAQENYLTVFEKSGAKETATYEELITYYQQLSNDFTEVTIAEKGLTDAALPLHLVKASSGEGREKLRILINNGIHPGEPDGIDASMMLLRDLLLNKKLDFNLFIIPVYNIGGALNRNSTSRVNQQGPEEYGFRGNSRNYDLNRDFIKADTRNTQSFYEIFHEVQPDIFIDTHVSNGADYQHNITHLFTQHNKLNSNTGEFLYNIFIPAVETAMVEKGDPVTPYVNVFNRTPDAGFSQFIDWPRYSTGYAALFNTIAIMIETHMLKPYDVRVNSTYRFLMAVLEAAKAREDDILALREDNSWWPTRKALYPLDWSLDKKHADSIRFFGYKGIRKESNVTGQQRLYYDHEQPYEKNIPHYNHFIADQHVSVPHAYIIPQGWHEIIKLLKQNNVRFKRIERDTLFEVEVYKIKKYNTSNRPYEGHYPHNEVEVFKFAGPVNFRKGDYIFPVSQRSGRYLIETLEPQGHDSFFAWNFFDTILQRKEGFSPYVFEEIAEGLLKDDAHIKEDFQSWKAANNDFRDNGFAQLQFIYEKSAYAEKEFLRYPVYRQMVKSKE